MSKRLNLRIPVNDTKFFEQNWGFGSDEVLIYMYIKKHQSFAIKVFQ